MSSPYQMWTGCQEARRGIEPLATDRESVAATMPSRYYRSSSDIRRLVNAVGELGPIRVAKTLAKSRRDSGVPRLTSLEKLAHAVACAWGDDNRHTVKLSVLAQTANVSQHIGSVSVPERFRDMGFHVFINEDFLNDETVKGSGVD